MECLSVAGFLVRDRWPDGRGKLTLDVEQQLLAHWQLCPTEYNRIPLFATIQMRQGLYGVGVSRLYGLNYQMDVPDKDPNTVPINLHIQGFVESKNIRRLGNWFG